MTLGIQQVMQQVEQVRDGFRRAVLAGDVGAALDVCDDAVVVVALPMATGASGADQLRRFLVDDVVGHLPADLTHIRVARTVDRWRIVDEERVAFTHDRALPWLLPGVTPTGRRVEALAVSIATVRVGRLHGLRVLWDLPTLLAGLGLPPDAVRPGVARAAGGR